MKKGDAILQLIAVEVVNSKHGDFLKHVAHAWLSAEGGNKTILKPAWVILVNQYGLEKEFEAAIDEHLEEYLVEA